MFNWKYLLASLSIVGFGVLGYLTYADKLPGFLSGQFFLSQVTSLPDADLAYIQSISDLALITSFEDLEQKFISTLLENSMSFDETSATAAGTYLKTHFSLKDPIPSSISSSMTTAAQKFLQAQALLPVTISISPFLNEVLSILANHQVATNNHQAVKRAQTTRNLLDSLIKQL